MKYLISFALACLLVFSSKNGAISNANIFIKLIGVLVAYFGAFYGIKIGTIIRNWLMPDYIITDGSVASIVKTKVFWAAGLQTVGCIVGAALAVTLFFKVAGPSKETIYNDRVEATAIEVQPYLNQWNKAHAQEIASNKARIDTLYTNNNTTPDEFGNKPFDHNLNADERAAVAQAETAREQCNSGGLGDSNYKMKMLVCRHRDYLFNALKARGICQYGGETDRPWFHCQ